MIPLLVGGAAAAAVAVIAKSVSSSSGNSSSHSSSAQIESKKSELEREQQRKESVARQASLHKYIERVTSNLARKYAISDVSGLSEVLILGLMSKNGFSGLNHMAPLEVQDPKSILYTGAGFQKHQQKIERVEQKLLSYKKAKNFLEEIDEKFK